MTDLKRQVWNQDKWWQFWAAEYNLYGDPAYGSAPASTSAAQNQSTTAGPVPSLDVVVPDYQVRSSDGVDRVEIPGGYVWLEEGKPETPYYSVALQYPQGCRIQDVGLTGRSGLTAATGLNLPIATMDFAGLAANSQSQPSSSDDGWLPQAEYTWDVLQNPEGTTVLNITMYPFYYNPLTSDVQFYKNYSFAISYTVTAVGITNLKTDRDAYRQGERVVVDIDLNNAGEVDVIVNAAAKRYGTDEVVDGLLLHTLQELAGPASFSPQWDSNGFEPGYYYVEVTLQEPGGNVLDRRTEMFRLGISSGEITSLTATPAYFSIGDHISISLVFSNTGTVNITGTARIQVQDESGVGSPRVQSRRHRFGSG